MEETLSFLTDLNDLGNNANRNIFSKAKDVFYTPTINSRINNVSTGHASRKVMAPVKRLKQGPFRERSEDGLVRGAHQQPKSDFYFNKHEYIVGNILTSIVSLSIKKKQSLLRPKILIDQELNINMSLLKKELKEVVVVVVVV